MLACFVFKSSTLYKKVILLVFNVLLSDFEKYFGICDGKKTIGHYNFKLRFLFIANGLIN